MKPTEAILFPLLTITISLLLLIGFSTAELSDATLKELPDPGSDFDIKDGALLAPILVPRIPESAGSRAVLQHFIKFFKTELPEWELEFQNSSFVTPVSQGREVTFVNLIASRDPPLSTQGETERLTLVAHYDSLSVPEGFIGATDSAAPCAILLHVARSIDKALSRKWAAEKAATNKINPEVKKGIQILLLDGEEAFKHWTDTDSIYGARGLAEAWDNHVYAEPTTFSNRLQSISLFVLLDLLGAKNPGVKSYFKVTHWAYKVMAKMEDRLRKLSLLKSSPNHPSKRSDASEPRQAEPSFLPEANKADTDAFMNQIGDDHVPFMARGVSVLHIIPLPFPAVWHTPKDDGEHLDADTVEDWAKIVTAFTAEMMDLEGHFEHSVLSSSLASRKEANKEIYNTTISKTEL